MGCSSRPCCALCVSPAVLAKGDTGQRSANSHFQAGAEHLEKAFSTLAFNFYVLQYAVKPPPALPCDSAMPVLALPTGLSSPWSCLHPPGAVPSPAASRGDMRARCPGCSRNPNPCHAGTALSLREVKGEEEPFAAGLAGEQAVPACCTAACSAGRGVRQRRGSGTSRGCWVLVRESLCSRLQMEN